jgi:RHS repeat-associated protein
LGSSLTTDEYDYRNRLVRVSAPEGESRYRYDGLGRRIRVEEPGSTTRYVVDPTAKPYETLEERDDSGTLRTAFVLGAGLVAERRANTDLRYFHFDGLGSTTAITDSTGVDVAHVAYHAFGDTAMDLGASDTRRGFVGRFGVEGTPTGLIFMRDRFYDSTIGQFLSEDPTLRADTEVLAAALHLYADGNPVLEIDPDGHEPITLLAMGITIGLAAYSAWEAHKSAKRAVTQQVAMDRARGISGERLTNRALTVGLTEYSTQLAWGWVMGKATKGVTPNVYGDQAAGLASEKGTGWAVSQLNRTYLYPALLGERSAAPKTKAPQMCKPVKPMVRMKPLGGLSSQHPAAYKAPAKFVPPQQKPKKTRR